MVVAFKTDPPASEKDFHAVGRASAKIQRWEEEQFGWMIVRGRMGALKLEGRQGSDPTGFLSQEKEFGFHSNCDGSYWMAVNRE